jgi:hypothetical protein
MGDPLSVAASVVGIVSLGIQTCHGLVWYIDLRVDRKEDLAQSEASALALLDVLTQLKGHIKDESLSATEVKIIEHNVEACNKWILKLQEKLRKYDVPIIEKDVAVALQQETCGVTTTSTRKALEKARLQVQKAAYPFKKGALDKICLYISNARSSLSLAVETLHL